MADYGQAAGLAVTLSGPFTSTGGSGGKTSSVTLSAGNWKSAVSPYTQTVAVDGISKTSRIEIVSSETLIAKLAEIGCALCSGNSSGTVTFYAVGACPAEDLTLGLVLEDVSGAEGTIYGNSVGADFAAITAEDVGALSSSGGNMTGAIAMNGNRITGVSTPTADTDAANKSYTDTKATAALKGAVTSSNAYTDRMTQTLRTEINSKAERTTYSVLIPASGWSGDSTSGYTCEVGITGITDMDTPHISPVYSGDDLATALAEKAAWNAIDTAVAGNDLITFYAFEEQPTTDLTVTVEVVS